MPESAKTVLLVEDSLSDRTLIFLALKEIRSAHHVIVAHDGQEALDLLFGEGIQAGIAPDLVFLDLHIPRVGGLEVLRRLRSHPRTRHAPVVVLSTTLAEADVESCYQLGANGYIQKPQDPDLFVETVRELGRRWTADAVAGDEPVLP